MHSFDVSSEMELGSISRAAIGLSPSKERALAHHVPKEPELCGHRFRVDPIGFIISLRIFHLSLQRSLPQRMPRAEHAMPWSLSPCIFEKGSLYHSIAGEIFSIPYLTPLFHH